MNESENLLRRVFAEALEIEAPGQRAAFLSQACGRDAALRREVEELLQAESALGQFLPDRPSSHGVENALGEAAKDPESGDGVSRPAVTEQLGDRIGHYKLLQKIGEGGCGVVYRAEQQEPVRRKVALKVIKLGMDTKTVVARFEAERQALAMMDHPNIAKVLDAGATDAGRPYFVMELVRGIKITDYCDQNNLPTKERLDLFIKVCQAIQHAHQKGIIHRDIKPSNILVTLHDGVPVPKVIDFGIAKAVEGRLTEATVYTQLHQFIGTPAYMSPEQAEMSGLDVDTRSDIYSLGVLLYELLVGRTPFDAKELIASGVEAMRKTIREQEPLRPSTKLAILQGEELTTTAKRRAVDSAKLASLLRGDLDWIVMKCLEKDRTQRYDTANGLAMDLMRHLKHELVVARPPSLGYRLQKSFRRNRVLFTAAGLVGLTLVLGALISIWQAVRATRAGRHEAEARVRADQAARVAETQRERADKEAQMAKVSALEARQQAYATDMNLAQHALAVNNIGRAGELLNRHRPQAGESDLRGWEWRYLWQQCRSDALLTVCQQSNSIFSLTLSPDGKWLAVGEYNSGGLSVRDLATRGEVVRLTGGDVRVRVAFSPREPLLAFSTVKLRAPDPQCTICLWNGTIKKIVAEFDLGGECMGLGFTDDGQTLVSYAGNPVNQIALWRVPAGTKLLSYAVSPFEPVSSTTGTCFALASQGNVVAVGPDNTIHLIDLRTGKERWAKRATDEWIKALALSPDGQMLASGAGFTDSTIRLWDVASGKEITRLQGHRAWVSALVFWPDGKTLASASADQSIQLWDLTDLANVPPPRALRGHRQEVWQLALLPDGRTLASGCKDGSVYIWDTTSIQHERARAILPITVAAWRLGLERAPVLTVDLQGHITLWKGTDLRERESLMDLDAPPSPCGWPLRYSALISGDARLVAAGSTNGLIKVWDLQQRRLLRQFPIGTGLVAPLEFLAQGKSLVTCHWNDDIVREWDIASGQEVRAWPQTVEDFFVAFSPDGRWSLLLDIQGASLLREMTTHHDTTQTLDVRGVQHVVFSPDGRRFAAASELGYVKLWDRATLRELAVLRGFLMGIHSIAFSPDAKRVAAAGDGKEAVKLWDLQSWQELLTLEGQGSLFWPIAFSADGNVVGSCSVQGALNLWRAPSWAEIEAAEKTEGKAE